MECLKNFSIFFQMYLIDYLKGKHPNDACWREIEDFYTLIWSKIKATYLHLNTNWRQNLHILVNLEDTYKDFERCN